MPHCQKEDHNRAGKSKKERLKAKQDAIARKQRLREEREAAEAEAALKLSNNIAPVEGHGEYEVGYEPEPEYTRFNVKKRSKKHLRNDLRKKMLREAQEEEERLRKQQEEEYRQQQKALKEASGEVGDEKEEEEEPSPILEYFVFICECCDKRYATKNQFLNHTKSKKHKSKVRIYEELGILVTHVELRGENGNENEIYDDDEEDNEDWENQNKGETKENDETAEGIESGNNSDDDGDSEREEESDDDDYVPQKRSMFASFAAVGFGSSSEDEDSSDDDDDEEEEEDRKPPPAPPNRFSESPPDQEEEEDIDFDELIHQNQLLQEQIDAEQTAKGGTIAELPPTPLPFHETYDPDDYDVNENRLASVTHRLRKNLAKKGITPSSSYVYDKYDPLDAITMGKTLLQEVLEANIDTLEQRLEAYKKHKEHCELMAKEFALAKGNSKALPAQYIRKQDAADNARRRANIHHAGSHYHMQAARTMQFGRRKGMMARHSNQGARLQASRMAAKMENARVTSKGAMKSGKVSSKKKSTQKKMGDAGGSKKSGGAKGAGGD